MTIDLFAKCPVISARSEAEIARDCRGIVKITVSAREKSKLAISSTALSRIAP
jgi:hypothetical protein